MSSSNLVRIAYVKETAYGVTPPAVASSVVIQDITYTADVSGGNDGITIEYADTGTAGAETVLVTDTAILVGIEDGVSTATQVKAAIDGSTQAAALVNAVISGTAGDTQVTQTITPLIGGSGGFKLARFTSEGLNGSAETTESQQIRTDRMSSGQIVTGLEVGGSLAFELAKEEALEDFMSSAMYNPWDVQSLVTVNLTIDATNKTLDRASGDWTATSVGDFITLSGFALDANNVTVMIAEIVDGDTIRYVGPEGMTSVAGTGTAYKRADKLTIGTAKQSMTMEKAFLDLTESGIVYRGMIASQMELNIAFGELVTGSFEFSGNDWDVADEDTELVTYQRTLQPQATSLSMNGSIDMPFLATSTGGDFEDSDFCIQSLDLTLNNNLSAQNCIGNIAPEDYTPGTAQIEINMSTYLKDQVWSMLPRKLTQEPFSLGFLVKNLDGAYGFYMPQVQVSFDDPASGGANQDVSLEMSGVAKVGANGESSLTIYRIP